MARARVLIIEDDASIRAGLVSALRASGYAPLDAADGTRGLALALGDAIDLVLLDLMLPGLAGTALLAELRRARPTLPVICVTARGEPAERVAGLRAGADDYIVKPFGIDELLARIEAVLRRSAERPAPRERFVVAGRRVDLGRREITTPAGATRAIPQREGELLAYLAASAGRAISRDELLERVWRLDPRGGSTRSVDMAVARLRELMDDDAAEPVVIRTVRGKGYALAELERNGAPDGAAP